MEKIKWLGHASVMLKNAGILFIDPFDIQSVKEKADIIFVTHAHYDHWSPQDLEKLVKSDTKIFATNGCGDFYHSGIQIVGPDQQFEAFGIKVRTVPAYTVGERDKYHPRRNNWVGYIIDVGGFVVYHAGDTDFIPEMNNLGRINHALLPMGGTYTMDVEEAIKAANVIRADTTSPIHYKRLLKDASASAEQRFTRGVDGKVQILKE